jgi:outer membrane protein OmpA-like peptidoglycan-associated protein
MRVWPVSIVCAAALAALLLAGCATEEYVEGQVAPVRAEAQAANATANEALQRAQEAHLLAQGKFLYQVVLSDEAVKFPTGSDQLSPEAERRLAQLAAKLKHDNRNVYLEIQGYTDSQGAHKANLALGQARAEAARRYLARQGVPLNRMSTISYGEEDPVAPNGTAQGRAQNRRIVVVVLA